MKLRHLAPALIVSLPFALGGQPVEAQHHGGRHGGHGGGGHAVPRSGGGYPSHGGVAGARHPRAGTGGYGHYYGHYYRGHSGPYYRGYYPYYGYGYRPYFYGSLYFGWPYYNGWPYDSVAYYSGPGYSMGYSAPPPYYGDGERPAPPPREASRTPDEGSQSGRLRLEVRPEDASVYVDDVFRGTGREARSLELPPGLHTIELVRPGYATERREVEIVTGARSDVLVEMQRPR